MRAIGWFIGDKNCNLFEPHGVLSEMKAISCTLVVGLIGLMLPPAPACTVFVLSDDAHTYCFGNENTALTDARIWFLPAGDDYHGAVYIGFNGAAETGMNTTGLAFDWVAQFNDEWNEQPDTRTVRGNYGQRMLEQCDDLEEAIAFCREYPNQAFAKVRLLIADKSGASAIVGVRDGRMFVDRFESNHGMGTGFGGKRLEEMTDALPEVDIIKGFELLVRCFEQGETPTLYSSMFDLKNGEIRIKHVNGSTVVVLNLAKELELGAHHYVVKELHKEAPPRSRPLEISMHRFPVDTFKPSNNEDLHLVRMVERTIRALSAGRSPGDFTDRYRAELSGELETVRSEFEALGPLQRVTMVQPENRKNAGGFYFRLEFANALIIQRFQLDTENKIDGMTTVVSELKGRD